MNRDLDRPFVPGAGEDPGNGHYPFFDKEGEYVATMNTTGAPNWEVIIQDPLPAFWDTEAKIDDTVKFERQMYGRMCICFLKQGADQPDRWWIYVEPGGEDKVFCRFTIPGHA